MHAKFFWRRNQRFERFGTAAFALLLIFQIAVSCGCGEKNVAKATKRDPGSGAINADDFDQKKLAAKNDLNTSYFHKDLFGVFVINVPSILADEKTKDVEWNLMFQDYAKYFGDEKNVQDKIKRLVMLFDIKLLDLMGSMQSNNSATPPKSVDGFLLVIEAIDNFDQQAVAKNFAAESKLSEVALAGGSKKMWLNQADNFAIHFIDARHLVIGSVKSVKRIAENNSTTSELGDLAAQMELKSQLNGVMLVSTIRPVIRSTFGNIGSIAGPQFKKMLELPEVTDSVTFDMDLSADELCRVVVKTQNEKYAKDILGLVRQSIEQFSKMSDLVGSVGGNAAPEMMVASETADVMPDLMKEIVDGGMVADNNGSEVTISVKQTELTRDFVRAVVKDANRQRDLQRRKEALTKIGRAMRDYCQEYEAFPAVQSITGLDAKGRPKQFSWRVAILPQLGHQKLYDQFKFDEAWDSEHNLTVAQTIPDEYAAFAEENRTSLHVVGGIGPFAENKVVSDEDVTDEIDETALVVEGGASTAVVWTKPGLIEATAESLPALGRDDENGILVLMFQGNVRMAKKNPPEIIRAIITPAADDRVTSRSFFGGRLTNRPPN